MNHHNYSAAEVMEVSSIAYVLENSHCLFGRAYRHHDTYHSYFHKHARLCDVRATPEPRTNVHCRRPSAVRNLVTIHGHYRVE
jgi:hypothetical protein